jgi:hypothetical protein
MIGDKVSLLQTRQRLEALRELGHYQGDVAAAWTTAATDALKQAQTALGVGVDGKWGPETEDAIQKALAAKKAPRRNRAHRRRGPQARAQGPGRALADPHRRRRRRGGGRQRHRRSDHHHSSAPPRAGGGPRWSLTSVQPPRRPHAPCRAWSWRAANTASRPRGRRGPRFVLAYGCLQITRQRSGQPASYSLHATPRAPLMIINPGTYCVVAERSALGLRGSRRKADSP